MRRGTVPQLTGRFVDWDRFSCDVAKQPAVADADLRIISAVKALSYEYEFDNKDTVIVTVSTGKDKTRLVLIESKTECRIGSNYN